jgi:hypothetical protein
MAEGVTGEEHSRRGTLENRRDDIAGFPDKRSIETSLPDGDPQVDGGIKQANLVSALSP